MSEENLVPETGMYANHYGYTDVNPYEITRAVSGKCLEVRPMDSVLDPAWKPDIVVGGFSGHTVNNHSQQWIITSNPELPVTRIRKRKDGTWGKGSLRFRIEKRPVKFYDYNF